MKKLYLLLAFILITISGCAVVKNHIIKERRKSFVHLLAVSEVSPGFKFPVSMASGFVVQGGDNYNIVLTAAHFCVKSMEEEEMSFHDEFYVSTIDERSSIGNIIAVDRSIDVCLLKINNLNVHAVKFARNSPEITDQVINIGAPAGMVDKDMVMIYEGRYMGIKQDCATGKHCAIYNIPAYPGSSGSFILDENGDLIGMVSATIGGFYHMAMSPTWWQMIQFVEEQIDLPYVISSH
tara:strand:- start:1932 stop:2642 length:711 start_codon:yes stop_codon:yes gene_type:complete